MAGAFEGPTSTYDYVALYGAVVGVGTLLVVLGVTDFLRFLGGHRDAGGLLYEVPQFLVPVVAGWAFALYGFVGAAYRTLAAVRAGERRASESG
ncbi:MAG: hypothetical protein ABEJ04_00635 [Halobacteriaceae archaeon]